ncbi:MAG TPA: Ig domain-containing protein [Trueperaceae bacterium]|nr:Ig domain-containing protein [Trueperaceae bacterium]
MSLSSPSLLARLLAALLLVAGLAACAGELATPGEALRLLGTDLPEAVVAEPYQVQFHAVGGLRPYEYSLSAGALPPGLELQGGELRGVPSTTGEYEFTIEVTDANLSSTFLDYVLSVITPPAPTLDLQLPDTEVRSKVTVRARVTDARALVGVRTELSWDAERFTLEEGSLSASRQEIALIHEAEPGRLRLDLALLGTTLQGDAELFSFVLVPVEVPAVLAVGTTTEFASRSGDEFRHEFAAATASGAAVPGAFQTAPEDLDTIDGEPGEEPGGGPSEEPEDEPGEEPGEQPDEEPDDEPNEVPDDEPDEVPDEVPGAPVDPPGAG